MSKIEKKTVKTEESSGRFDFIGLGKIFVPLTSLFVLISFILILTQGFEYGVEFAGGTEVQVRFNQPLETSKVRAFLESNGFQGASIQSFEKGNEFLIRLDPVKTADEKQANLELNTMIKKVTDGLTTTFQKEEPSILQVSSVGPQVGSELKRNGILAAFYSLLMILIYIGLRFDYKFAPGAVFCLFHDSIVILGIYSLFKWEMNVQIMAAVLTIIGYSLNDTIVIFDRIRENEKLYRDKSFTWICNRSINDSLARTILTSATTFSCVVVMWVLAGGVIKEFAMTMAIGIVIGAFSTVYVATPLVIWMDRLERAKKAV